MVNKTKYVPTKCSVDGVLTPNTPNCKRCCALNSDEFVLNKYGDRSYKQNWFLYILLLTDQHWYIGISKDVRYRLLRHFLGAGAQWTKLHSPVAVHKMLSFPLSYSLEHMQEIEDLATLKYMRLYGKEKVRGGSFCSRYNLSEFDTHRIRSKAKQLSIKSPTQESWSSAVGSNSV